MSRTRIFKVTVHIGSEVTKQRVAASQDLQARERAVRKTLQLYNQNLEEDEARYDEDSVDYCETELLAETD
jgi:uncharacterized protein YacL (UPF0231 family)